MKAPILMVMAGPNGSGKSTITARYQIIGDYINADDIQRHLDCTALEAAQTAEATREYMLSENRDFTFETVLSTPRNLNLMQRAKNNGYTIICIYVLTKSAEINISRVEARAKKGQHYVAPEKVQERYDRAMKLFPKLFDVCDELYVYDNSLDRSDGEPQMILCMKYGQITLYPGPVWTKAMLGSLCSGTYSGENSI